MTTEPKDVRGGDEAKRSALSPSDPSPVREAVAWRVEHIEDGHVWFAQTHDRVRRIEKSPHHFRVTPLYTDPLPVSREAVARQIEEIIACDARVNIHFEITNADELADAILALTGETSRE